MSRCFRASTRFADVERRGLPEGVNEEVEFVSPNGDDNDDERDDAFLRHSWTETMTFLANKLVWFYPDLFVTVNDSYEDLDSCPELDVAVGEYRPMMELTVSSAATAAGGDSVMSTTKLHVWENDAYPVRVFATADLLLNLLRNSQVPSLNVTISNLQEAWTEGNAYPLLPSAATLEQLLLSQRDELKVLKLRYCYLSEECFSVLGNCSCESLKLHLYGCEWDENTEGFASLRHPNRGAREIIIELFAPSAPVLNALLSLKGNARLESLSVDRTYDWADPSDLNFGGEEDMQSLSPVLGTISGLVEFRINFVHITDTAWTILWRSITSHPTLTLVDFEGTFLHQGMGSKRPKRLKKRTQAVAKSLRRNTQIESVVISQDERDEKIWRKQVRPLLDLNVFRPRFAQLSQVEDRLRSKLLGSALASVRNKPHLFYVLLREQSDSFGECLASKRAGASVALAKLSSSSTEDVTPQGGRKKKAKTTIMDT